MANPFWDILKGIEAVLTPIHPTADVRYDVTQLTPEVDPAEILLIAPAPERFFTSEGVFGGDSFYDFHVDIAWIQNTQRVTKVGQEVYMQKEWDTEQALFRVLLAGVSNVWDTTPESTVTQRIMGGNQRVRAWKLKYRVTITRSDA